MIIKRIQWEKRQAKARIVNFISLVIIEMSKEITPQMGKSTFTTIKWDIVP